MSLSSLPDIFSECRTASTPHRRQGNSFSLYLNGPLTNRNLTSRSATSQKGRQYNTLQPNKQRSASSSAMRPKNSALSDQKSKTAFTERNKNQVTFKDRVQIMGSSMKRGSGLAVINISNVWYQTSRKFNNRMVDLEQAGSLKNNTQTSLKEMATAEMQMWEVKAMGREIQSTFRQFITNQVDDMEYFQAEFAQTLKICYANLSKLRRETNQQMRGNRKELQKLHNEFAVCKSVLNEMTRRGEQTTNQTIQHQNQIKMKSISQESPRIDFQEISEIPKTSRGGTATVSKRNRLVYNDEARRSADQDLEQLRGIAFD